MNPKEEGACDDCGGEIYQREDDKEETIRNRLRVYEEQTSPLISFYNEKGLILKHDASQEVTEVFGDLVKTLWSQ
jgi:adenylate kinase